jgi:hypothetical protein
MASLVDVSPGDIVTSARQNDINDYIQDGTHKINTLSVDIGGTETIDSSRNITANTFIQNNGNGTGWRTEIFTKSPNDFPLLNAYSEGSESAGFIKKGLYVLDDSLPQVYFANSDFSKLSSFWHNYSTNKAGFSSIQGTFSAFEFKVPVEFSSDGAVFLKINDGLLSYHNIFEDVGEIGETGTLGDFRIRSLGSKDLVLDSGTSVIDLSENKIKFTGGGEIGYKDWYTADTLEIGNPEDGDGNLLRFFEDYVYWGYSQDNQVHSDFWLGYENTGLKKGSWNSINNVIKEGGKWVVKTINGTSDTSIQLNDSPTAASKNFSITIGGDSMIYAEKAYVALKNQHFFNNRPVSFGGGIIGDNQFKFFHDTYHVTNFPDGTDHMIFDGYKTGDGETITPIDFKSNEINIGLDETDVSEIDLNFLTNGKTANIKVSDKFLFDNDIETNEELFFTNGGNSFKIGWGDTYPTMTSDHGDFSLGASGDDRVYINYYTGSYVDFGSSSNIQSVHVYGTIHSTAGITSSGNITAVGNVNGANLSGTNTGNVSLSGKDYLTLSGQIITANSIDLTDDVSGALPVANGGTGKSSVTSNSYLKGNGTSVLTERTYSEVKSDLSLNNVENTALSTWAGSSNITTLGTISTGIWQGTDIAVGYIDGSSGTNGQVLTTDGTNATWQDASGGGGASMVFERHIEGDLYTTTLMPIIIPDELNGLDIKEVRISLASLPTGADFKVDVRKNGTATTDSIFTSDAEIEIGTGQSATNGLYQTACDTSGARVGTPGTTIDSARDSVASDDVLWIVITSVGSTLAGTDFSIFVTVE